MQAPEGAAPIDLASYLATVVDRIGYASLEQPRIDDPEEASFDIPFCPHQDHDAVFDRGVQR